MLLSAKIAMPLAAASALMLSGCSTVLPLDYKNYTGPNAATLVVQHKKGEGGLFYLAFYEKKGECYDRIERYELNFSASATKGSVISYQIAPGKFVVVEQSHGIGNFAKIEGKFVYHSAGYSETQWIPFITQPGKRYFVARDYGVRVIPANYSITPDTNPAKVFRDFPQQQEPNWNANQRCPHLLYDN
ncbi:hypothetical protein BBB56_16840 [Candidatus Pantoea deserta]|uniref:Lipoprotein n=1 Tax=Candidatus Pantoea deserta TaxID=1869313 RepID=A0A3N4NNK5_9GAMM|nr:hypothetical protein [Pantoea deserta]RPD97861.1 hypothetical protein BBB56_16840 [Pantoea deserta]